MCKLIISFWRKWRSWSIKEAQFDKVDEENIKQWLENDAEIPGHKICGEAEGEEDKIASSVCVPLQAALESADLLRFMEQHDDTSYTDILHLQKTKMNRNKKLSAAKVQKKMTDFFKKNNQWILQYLQAHYAIVYTVIGHLPYYSCL